MVEGRARVGVGDDLAYKLRSEPNQNDKLTRTTQVPDTTRKLKVSLIFVGDARRHASVRAETSCVTEAVATGFGGDKSGTVNQRIGGDK